MGRDVVNGWWDVMVGCHGGMSWWDGMVGWHGGIVGWHGGMG